MIRTTASSPPAVFARRAALVLAGSGLLYVSAQIAVPATSIWGVPITLQTLAIPVLVALLGRNLGVLAVVAYLAEGIAGLPVFQGHSGGIHVFVGPTGGYLVGFPIAAYVTGTLYRLGFDRGYGRRFVAVLLGTSVVFVTGPLWLAAVFFGGDLGRAFTVGVAPFIIGDLAKCLVAAGVRPRGDR
ncbi:biotin biosynthesis protein BioY [Vulcanimicrobium alpinum]|uniref:Biotin transporter n=1 Tax=Vulcanimicrobium alpinum TaxID=3016050 RepID=A0AAN2C8A4_UNVUL|nr:biotin transporter BioY [Vulcanimicrobium alpinum]BDE05385.1 biotin biosynthesis protein BioY [Vulcanimicrobium alpinum]